MFRWTIWQGRRMKKNERRSMSTAGEGNAENGKVITLHPGKGERVYEKTIISNSHRYRPNTCEHKGPYVVDQALAAVECGECGAYLNPLFVLEKLATQEAYWNKRQEDLTTYLAEITAEIKDRTRTKCTHCGNMTAIKFSKEMPRTWVPRPY